MQRTNALGQAPMYRKASSNYLNVERERSLSHLQSFRAYQSPTNAGHGHGHAGGGGAGGGPLPTVHSQEAVARLGPFELLQLKFGFQQSSVANQKENLGVWITNYQLRVRSELAGQGGGNDEVITRTALVRVHQKFFKNYVRWCAFLRTKPHISTEQETTDKMERELALFLLLWGEAGNVRFMPECVCFLYHTMGSKLDFLDSLPTVDEGFYLTQIVRPIYSVISKMRTTVAPEGQKPIDHQDIINYDDVNEFFWTPKCLDCDEMNIAATLEVQEPKSFREKRSVFNPLLAFFRIWYFLIVMFHAMVALVYVSYMSEGDDDGGLGFFFRVFDSGQNKIRAHAFYSVFLSITGFQALKVILQIWLYELRMFRDAWMAVGVFCRLMWHTFFFALFGVVYFSPNESGLLGSMSSMLPGGGKAGTYLSMGLIYVAVYCIPVLVAATVRAYFPQGIWNVRLLNSLDGTRRQYIGRHTAQPWGAFIQYAFSWLVIFGCKFLFALQFMVRPLIAPSVEIYNLDIADDDGWLKSGHNILFIIALWFPVFVVYMYDTQIWFILYQSIVGLVMGKVMKIGHYVGLNQLKVGMSTAPQLFDEKVISQLAKTAASATTRNSGGPDKLKHHDHVRLRFAIMWNQVVDNFRLNDLLDDRETVILQYRILNKGERIQEPIFLLAGKLSKAIEIAAKSRKNRWNTPTLIKNLANADTLEGIKNSLELVRDIFYLLLGENDQDGALSVLEYIYTSPDIVALIDMSYLPALADNMVELLAVILDMPEEITSIDRIEQASEELRMELRVQVAQVVDRLRAIVMNLELMLNDDSVSRKLHNCTFLQGTADMSFQTQQLIALYKADAVADTGFFSVHRRKSEESSATSARFAREDFISSCTRLFFLLRLDVASSLPRCEDAKRRMGFFLHSLAMEMPRVASMEAMPSFSVMTPYYSETVLFTLDELNNPVHSNELFAAVEQKQKLKGHSDLTIMKYLITFHAEEWSNFLERMGVATLEDALEAFPMQVRLWASLRGQTLARTVQGMMLYEDAIRLLRWLELYSLTDMDAQQKLDEMNRISALKFSYITGCQIYSQQVAKGDPRAADIDFLMKKFPSWRVSFVDPVKNPSGEVARYDCVLVKSENDEIVEVYRYELPGNPILGEGKPENQNVALVFTRGEYIQTIDMNQEHYFEETIKMPNFLATATAGKEEVTCIGMKEHVFTGRASSLARFMTLQELVFVTLTQRVLAKPLRSRMHYGHPDVFEKSFVMTCGGVSKASKGINLSEDVFSGYNVTLRGGLVTHVEFMQCGKGRDVTLSQINAFEAKLSNGCAESCLSREGHRLSHSLDFTRLNSMWFGHFGFYICNALTVLCVYIYAYCKLYVATHEEVEVEAVMATGSLSSLSSVMTTQYVLQFGMLTTLPLLATLFVEFGLQEATLRVVELLATCGIVFYVFLTGTKAHYYDVALIRGGSKYRGTGRGFSITRDPMVNFFKEYGVSHFRKAVELIGIMILFGVYGSFDIGATALKEYCATASFDCDEDPNSIPSNITSLNSFSKMSQSYGLASFAVLFLGACWLLAPFIFNTDGLVLQKSKLDIANWFAWMMHAHHKDDLIDDGPGGNSSGAPRPKDGWDDFWASDVDLMTNLGPMGRITYCLRELRHPLAMYFVFMTHFSYAWLPLLVAAIGGVWAVLWFGNRVHHCLSKVRKLQSLTARGIIYMVGSIGGIFLGPLIFGKILGWSLIRCFTLSASIFLGLNSIVQFGMALHGVFGFKVALWSPVMCLGFLMDMVVGFFLVVPLIALSLLPFMRLLQTRMMYNGGFSKALSSGSEVAASLCILLGLVGGFIFGFMYCFLFTLGYVNDTSDNYANRSFIYFVKSELSSSGLLSFVKNGYLKVACAVASMVGIALTLLIGRFLGRRYNMGIGCVLIAVATVLNWVSSMATVIVACCIASAGCGMLSMNYLLYSFEICTKGWRGKSTTIFLLGAMIGYFVYGLLEYNVNQTTIDKIYKNEPTNQWRLYPLVIAVPVMIPFFTLLWFVPESPVWLLAHKQDEEAKLVLIRLRRRQDVSADVSVIHNELTTTAAGSNFGFRLLLVCSLQAVFGLFMSNALLIRVSLASDTATGSNSNWLVQFAVFSGIGFAFGSFLVDNVRRKTILKEFLPFVSLCCFTCGVIGAVSDADSGFVLTLVCIMYIAAGFSLMSVTWLSALEMFPASRRPHFWALSLCVFYTVQIIVYLFEPSFALSHFIACVCCAGLTAFLFMFCASTKLGAIQLKSEKKKQRAMEEQAVIAAVDIQQEQQELAQKLQTRIAKTSAAMTRPVAERSPTVVVQEEAPTGGEDSGFDDSSSYGGGSSRGVVSATSGRMQFGHLSSTFDFDGDEMDDRINEMVNHEIAYPVQQPRSLSFLRSRNFPDAEIHAETNSQRL